MLLWIPRRKNITFGSLDWRPFSNSTTEGHFRDKFFTQFFTSERVQRSKVFRLDQGKWSLKLCRESFKCFLGVLLTLLLLKLYQLMLCQMFKNPMAVSSAPSARSISIPYGFYNPHSVIVTVQCILQVFLRMHLHNSNWTTSQALNLRFSCDFLLL